MARTDTVLTQQVGDELVVYDGLSNQAHCLNRTAALVWRRCDGGSSVAEIVAVLRRDDGLLVNQSVVWLALEQLERARLLQRPLERPIGKARVSRRQVVRHLSRMGGLAVLLPVVTSVVAPTPAMAQTPGPGTCLCDAAEPDDPPDSPGVTPPHRCNPGDVATVVTAGQCVGAGENCFGDCTTEQDFGCDCDARDPPEYLCLWNRVGIPRRHNCPQP
jgi:hypothetical protein